MIVRASRWTASVRRDRTARQVDRDRQYNSTFVVSKGRSTQAVRQDRSDALQRVMPYAYEPALQQLLELGAGDVVRPELQLGAEVAGVPIKRAAGPAVSGSGSGRWGTLSVSRCSWRRRSASVTKLTCRALAVGVFRGVVFDQPVERRVVPDAGAGHLARCAAWNWACRWFGRWAPGFRR